MYGFAIKVGKSKDMQEQSAKVALHYAQKFDELYEALKTRLGIEE